MLSCGKFWVLIYNVDRLSSPATGQAFIRDMELKGFAVRITSTGAKFFILENELTARLNA